MTMEASMPASAAIALMVALSYPSAAKRERAAARIAARAGAERSVKRRSGMVIGAPRSGALSDVHLRWPTLVVKSRFGSAADSRCWLSVASGNIVLEVVDRHAPGPLPLRAPNPGDAAVHARRADRPETGDGDQHRAHAERRAGPPSRVRSGRRGQCRVHGRTRGRLPAARAGGGPAQAAAGARGDRRRGTGVLDPGAA